MANLNCQDCIKTTNGVSSCANAYPTSNDLQGQINVCPSSTNWNYSQSAFFQQRNMGNVPAHGFLETEHPISFDMCNPERFRPKTHLPPPAQKLSNGSLTLNTEGVTNYNRTTKSSYYPIQGANMMYSALPPGNVTSTYCGPNFQNCYSSNSMTRAGPARDGCAPSSVPCSRTLSNL